MKQTILLLLKKDQKIEEIRKKNNIDIKKYKPHISLVYTFEVKDQKALFEHIGNAIRNIVPFDLELEKLEKSKKDYFLYLSPIKGKKEILSIHKQLSKGILSGFENKDMPKYIPHMSLGIFKSKEEIDLAIKKLKKDGMNYKAWINSIQLLTLNEDNSIKTIKNFKLK
jgi:2'-5' RNA ligase